MNEKQKSMAMAWDRDGEARADRTQALTLSLGQFNHTLTRHFTWDCQVKKETEGWGMYILEEKECSLYLGIGVIQTIHLAYSS